MTFSEFEATCPSTLGNPIAGEYSMEDMRLCWNAALDAAASVFENSDSQQWGGAADLREIAKTIRLFKEHT